MIAGATYTLPLDIRYTVQNTEKIIITLKNESTGIKRTKRYPNDEETRLLEDGRIGAMLTQQDTVDLVGYVKVEAQINLKSGSVAKTTTERTFISPTLNTEMVVGAADNGENLLDGVTLKLGAPITVVEGSEGTSFQPGNALELKDGILNVLTTDDAEQGNNLPITSKGARKLADNISYNDLKDRPFYEETEVVNEPLNITWDGNTEGLLEVALPTPEATALGVINVYKMSDVVLSDERLKSASIRVPRALNLGDVWDTLLGQGYIVSAQSATIVTVPRDQVVIVAVREDSYAYDANITLDKGLYFSKYNTQQYISSFVTAEPVEQTRTTLKKLDKKFMPDDIGDNGGGGGESLVFRVEVDTENRVTITPIEEILSAYESGKLLYIQELGTGTSYTNFLARVSYNYSLDSNYKPVNSSLKQFEFCSIVQRDGSFQSILIEANGTIDVLMKDISYVNDWQPS